MHRRYIPHPARIDRSSSNAQTPTARRMWRLMASHANFADHVIVPSHHFAKKLQRHGVNRPLTVVSNGLEETVLHDLPVPKPRSYDSRLPLKIMWCGRISPEKRPLEFLRAIKDITEPVTVDLYGDGIYLKKVQQYIKANQLECKVIAHGPVSQKVVLQQMVIHDLLAYTSFDFDNQPMVLLEAIAAGLPIVYCDPDLGETIPADGSILSSTPSPQHIAESIRTLCLNPEQINIMSMAMLHNRQVVLQSRQIKALVEVYETTSAAR